MFRRMLLCALVLAVACVVTGCSFYREPAALLPELEFGMSPEEAQAVLGEPTEVEKITGMNDVTYTWMGWENQNVAGHPATIRLKFGPFRREMILAQYIVTFSGEDRALLAELDSALAAQLTGDRGFIRRESTDSVSFDHNRGPVGTYYLLSVWDGNARLLGECDEYDR